MSFIGSYFPIVETFATCYHLCFIFPELFLIFAILYFLIAGLPFLEAKSEYKTNYVFIILTGVVLMIALMLSFNISSVKIYLFENLMFSDNYSLSVQKLLIIFSFFCIIQTYQYLTMHKLNRFEYFVFILFVILGLCFLVRSNDFLTFYLAIELQSLTSYLMVAYRKNHVFCVEAAIKYFVLSAIFSGILLFGIALIYIDTGTTEFLSLFYLLSDFYGPINFVEHPFVFFGFGCILASLFFKITAAPFHFWSPDVYEGASLIVTQFLAVVSKVGIFGILIVLVYDIFRSVMTTYDIFITFIIVSSLLVSASYAYGQFKLKRFFVYASISHVAIILMALYAKTFLGLVSSIFYVFIYSIMNLGSWSILLALPLLKKSGYLSHINGLTHMKKRNFMLTIIFSLLLFSMSGLPPLVGFYSKLLVFQSLTDSNFYLVIFFLFGVTVLSSFYYARIIKVMYYDEINLKGVTYLGKIQKPTGVVLGILFIFLLPVTITLDVFINYITLLGMTDFLYL